MRVDLFPGGGLLPRRGVARRRPGFGEFRVLVVILAIGEGVAVAVDRHAVGLAIPGADGRFQVVHVIVHIDHVLDPVGHLAGHASAQNVAFERRAHLDDVEIDGTGCNRLLQTRVVIGLRQVDPVDLGAGIGLPGFQETTEQEVVQVLVVQTHEGQFDTLKLAFRDDLLDRPKAQFADFLPIRIGGRAHADAGNLQDLGPQRTVGGGPSRAHRCAGGHTGKRGHRPGRAHALEHVAPAKLSAAHKLIVDMLLHLDFLPSRTPRPSIAHGRKGPGPSARPCRSWVIHPRQAARSMHFRPGPREKCLRRGQTCQAPNMLACQE